MTYTYDLRTQSESLQVLGQPGLHSKALSKAIKQPMNPLISFFNLKKKNVTTMVSAQLVPNQFK